MDISGLSGSIKPNISNCSSKKWSLYRVIMETNWVEVVQSFEEMGLREDLLQGIYAFGIERPSEIQQYGIVPITLGRNMIVQSKSGTGKTAMGIIGMLQLLDVSINKFQALILAPGREISKIIQSKVSRIGDFMGVRCSTCFGGTNVREEAKHLESGGHCIVGTPVRVYDMMRRNILKVISMRLIIIDDFDELVSRGLNECVKDIFALLPDSIQCLVISATIPHEILKFSENYLPDPVRIISNTGNHSMYTIKHYYVAVKNEHKKFETLLKFFKDFDYLQAIIYTNTSQKVEEVMNFMHEIGLSVTVVTKEMEQGELDLIMRDYGTGMSRYLITNEPLAQDINDMFPKINFDMPINALKYFECSGCNYRFFGQKTVINLVTEQELQVLKNIEQFFNISIKQVTDDEPIIL